MTVAIAGASAIGGGTIVGVSNYLVSRAQARDAKTGVLSHALVALLSTLNQIDHELRTEPQSKRAVRLINEQMATRFPQIDYVTGRIHRRLFQPHLDALIARLHDAMAATLLAAPQELLGPLQAVSDVMTNVERHSNTWRAEWDEARAELVIACRRVLGATRAA